MKEAWTEKEKPNVNQWYKMRENEHDFLRIRKDFRAEERKQTYYKIEEFVYGELITYGLTLAQARDFIRQYTWRKGY